MGTASWCHGAVRPCQRLSQCTQRLRAVFSTAATAEVAAQEEKEEVVKDAGVAFMRTSGRSWTIKPGLVITLVCLCVASQVVMIDPTDCYHSTLPSLFYQTHQGRDCTEEAGSAVSDEQSSGTLSSAYPSDTLIGCAQGTVRKAGALAVKNFLVHKKNKKVEPATKRKWKHYWVSLKGVV